MLTTIARRALWFFTLAACGALAAQSRPVYQSPYALVMAPDGRRLYVSHHTSGIVSAVDLASGKLAWKAQVGGSPAGLALSTDHATLYSAESASGAVAAIDARSGRVSGRIAAGRSAYGLAAAPKQLFVCDRFLNRVLAVDPAARKVTATLEATREPLFCTLTPDGATLLVANMLPLGPSLDPDNAAVIDIFDAAAHKRLASLKLPSGGTDVHQIAVSPDGKFAYVVHVVARFNVPPTQLERGWVNNAGLTIIDVAKRRVLTTVLLDEASRGYALPFGLAFSPDAKTLAVSFFGTHELALLDLEGLHESLAAEPADRLPQLINELSLLARYGVARRTPTGGRGPRGVAFGPEGKTLYVANTYSDSIGVVDVARARLQGTIPVGPPVEPDAIRRGEMLFNDATLCFQFWQSCSSCHPEARVDGLNWDLLNDGMGNPKNARSMLDSHLTPPVMASGVRAKMEVAVRSGLRYILFHAIDEAEAKPIDAYLRALEPRPSPYRKPDGSLTPAAARGQKLFSDPGIGCIGCHSGPLHTDLKLHDVGTRGQFDRRDKFDNPALRELWRTGPYLHDGRAVTLRDVLTTFNKGDRHGRTSHLKKEQIDDLVAYLLSL